MFEVVAKKYSKMFCHRQNCLTDLLRHQKEYELMSSNFDCELANNVLQLCASSQ